MLLVAKKELKMFVPMYCYDIRNCFWRSDISKRRGLDYGENEKVSNS